MIAAMAKKQARNERRGTVTKEGFAEFIGEIQSLLADAKSVQQILERSGFELIEMDGVGMGDRGLALCGIYLANIRRASHRTPRGKR